MLIGVSHVHAIMVKVIHEDRDRTDSAIIFIHGVAGDPIGTFTHKDSGTTWFQLIREDGRPLGGDRTGSSFDIYSLDYTDAFESDIGIDEIAKQIRDRSDFKRLFRDYNHLWFVAHSMGGIVLKRALVQMRTAQENRLLDRIRGVSLLSVPSLGAAVADVFRRGCKRAKWLVEIVARIVAQPGAGCSSMRDLGLVELGNVFLRQLENDWRELFSARTKSAYPFVVACAYESQAQAGGLSVVSQLYSTTACTGTALAVNATHTGVVKPKDQGADVHDWLMRNIGSALGALDDAAVVEWPGTLPLGSLLRMIEEQRGQADPSTGLPVADEVVVVGDKRLRDLVLRPGRYTGENYGILLRNVARQNTCVEVTIGGGSRREISLGLTVRRCGAVRRRGAGSLAKRNFAGDREYAIGGRGQCVVEDEKKCARVRVLFVEPSGRTRRRRWSTWGNSLLCHYIEWGRVGESQLTGVRNLWASRPSGGRGAMT